MYRNLAAESEVTLLFYGVFDLIVVLKFPLAKGAPMDEGIVKWFNKKKNYGFIESDEQVEIFFHGSNIADHGFFGLANNDRVTYEIKEMKNGPQAVRIKVIS